MADIWYDVDTALAEVPVNILPLLDATDFKTIEDAVAYNAAGLALHWHFCTTAGAYTVTAVTPTTGGNYDWTDQGTAGIYTIEIPASGGASINNDTEGFGWFTGSATGVLPWRGPVCGFRAAAINNSLIDGTTIDVNVTAMAANVVTASAIADAAIDLATFAADAKALMGVIAFGTAQSVTGTTIQLASAETFANDEIIGATVLIRSASTGAGQARVITDYVSSTDTATVDTWTTTPTGTITYIVFSTAPGSATAPATANVVQWLGTACATPTVAGVPEVDVTHNNGTAITAASGIQEVKVASIAANAITATSIAADAIGASELAADAVTEIQSGLATAAALTTVAGYIDTEVASILAAVDTEVAAIKAKTDSLTFTVAGQVDANIQSVNDVTVTGNGGTGTEWGP